MAYRLSETFKAMWASNGNELSKIYAGTGVIGTSSKVEQNTTNQNPPNQLSMVHGTLN